MNIHETTTPVRAFDRAYINGQFVTPHGTQILDLVNPTDNQVIGKVTLADETDARKAIAAAKEAFNTFSQSSKEYRMELLQRLHDAVAKRMDPLVEATVVEYGAPQDRAKGSNNLAANIFLHFKKVLEDSEGVKASGYKGLSFVSSAKEIRSERVPRRLLDQLCTRATCCGRRCFAEAPRLDESRAAGTDRGARGEVSERQFTRH